MKSSVVEKLSHAVERNDCAVRALTLATDGSYALIGRWLALNGHRPTRSSACADTRGAMRGVLGAYALEARQVQVKGRTLITLARELKRGTFIVFVRAHVLCVKDGVVLDWARGRGLRVKDVYRVVGATANRSSTQQRVG